MNWNLCGLSIAMLGGDRRELELAQTLLELNVDLRLVGYPPEPYLKTAKHFTDPVAAVNGIQVLIAPIANTDLEGKIFTRLDHLDPIDLTVILPILAPGTLILIGVAKPVIVKLAEEHGLRLVETADIDEIAILNSIPTAEGAIQLGMEELPITIHGSRCLVVGFGRCGQTLAAKLAALGARVTVVDRNKARLARAIEMGLTPVLLSGLDSVCDFDLIYNTVPALVITESYLTRLKPTTVIIDLAAAPGGVDFKAAQNLGIKAVLALSLPGKVAPVTAGKILSECIPPLLQELLGGGEYAT
ncbi:MAG TPA: dipicolinate synthase subunit DpsA [Firmicutes bacterium]|nr:dipicolinate synthase subunit DpsA [Bacillota bacterium]